MAENYKHLYQQMKKMVTMYQDEVVPGMRKTIEDLEEEARFTRQFIHEHGLEFALASAWERRKKDGK